MARQKFDGVVEAVRYAPDGQIVWVRAYERRGPTFSDVVLIKRDELVKRLQTGKKFYSGHRKEFLASDFEISNPLRLLVQDGKTLVVVNEGPASQDHLDGVPII